MFHSEYGGAIKDIDNLAQKFDHEGIILYKNNYFMGKIATPLDYIYQKRIENYTASSASISTLKNWTDSGKTLYLVDAINANTITVPPEGNAFTYDIQWKTFNSYDVQSNILQGMSFDNYYNYIVIPQKPSLEKHSLSIVIINKTNPLENMIFLNDAS